MTKLKIMPKPKVLASECGNGKAMTPKQLLEKVLERIENKEAVYKNATKAIVILLDDTDSDFPYSLAWHQAGMIMSQCVALCAVTQQKFFDQMK